VWAVFSVSVFLFVAVTGAVANSFSGKIFTVAGNVTGSGGDGGPATSASLNRPFGVAVLPDGGFLIPDTQTNRVRRGCAGGASKRVAGNGLLGSGGDGGPATNASLQFPTGVAVLPDGGFLIADTLSSRVRRVSADGVISTVAGNGTLGSGGD